MTSPPAARDGTLHRRNAAARHYACLATVLLVGGTTFMAGGCATTLPLESYVVEDVETHPTAEIFERSPGRLFEAVVAVLGSRGVPIDLAEPGRGRVITGWKEAPSLVYRRRRIGDAPVPLPARYRMVVTVTEAGEGGRVAVEADEETNFLILTGSDPESGRDYYRDSWRPTPTHTAREHEFLVGLREFLRRRSGRRGPRSRPVAPSTTARSR